jgi:hypothetical protein
MTTHHRTHPIDHAPRNAARFFGSPVHLLTRSPVLALLFPAIAAAQLIGPIPPAPTPPEPAAPVPAAAQPEVKPPPGEPDAPSIVERDKGRLKLLDSPEEAAAAKYPFDQDRRSRIAASLKSRAADMDRFVVASLDRVLEAQRLSPEVAGASDFDTLFKARDTVSALKFEHPLDRLLRDNAVSLEHKTRLDEAVREYDTACKKQLDADAGGDPSRAAVLNLRRTFRDVTREPIASLERQLKTLGDNSEAVLDAIPLHDSQREEAAKLRERIAAIPAADARCLEMLMFWKATLDLEQQRVALIAARNAAAAPPAPATPSPAAP